MSLDLSSTIPGMPVIPRELAKKLPEKTINVKGYVGEIALMPQDYGTNNYQHQTYLVKVTVK